jgi:HEAT repeat protein
LIATFHDAIRSAVPLILDLLKDIDWQVRHAGAKIIAKLAEHCKSWHLPYCLTSMKPIDSHIP